MRVVMLRGAALFAALAFAGVPVAAAGGVASAPVKFSVSVSRNSLSYHGTFATLSITMTTGASPEGRVVIGIGTPPWPEPGVGGSTLLVGHEAISGPGTIFGHAASSEGSPSDYQDLCNRGGTPTTSPEISLPADSSSTLSYRVSLSRPPWPGESLTLGLGATTVNTVGNTSVAVAYDLGSGRFNAVGPTGVETVLAAPDAKHSAHSYPVIPAGRTTTITGRTRPSLKSARISLGYRSERGGTTGSIGTVTTDVSGRFRARWTSIPAGTYVITARTPAARGILPDRSCDLALTTH